MNTIPFTTTTRKTELNLRTINELFEDRLKAQSDLKQLQAKVKDLTNALQSRIPVGETIQGVANRSHSRQFVSWSKAANKVIDELLPTSLHSAAQDIIDDHTKPSLVNKFVLVSINPYAPI
mgnify:CR=1 FL=1